MTAFSIRWLAILLLLSALPLHAADIRVGSADAKPAPDQFDANYPDMKEWAEAGVRGGIPHRDALKVLQTLKPGDNIQTAIDAAATAGGGVVVLSPGTYPIHTVLSLRTGVVLRGEKKDAVILENQMRSERLTQAFFTVGFNKVQRAGIEDLTLQHQEVAKLGLAVYAERVAGPINNPTGVTDLHVGGVQMADVEDCWIDNVSILHSGSHPLEAAGVRVTVRDTLIDGAFNKGENGAPAGEGNVYFSVTHGLMYHCGVSNVRHCLTIRDTLSGGDCKFNVFLDCDFTGSVNFHGNRRDSGHNLFEGLLVRSLLSHGWTAWSFWRREEIGSANLVYKSLGWGGSNADKFVATSSGKVYTFTGIKDPNILAEVEKAPPTADTLYATTASRPTKIESLGAWPKTPGEARDAMLKRLISSPLSRPTTKPAN